MKRKIILPITIMCLIILGGFLKNNVLYQDNEQKQEGEQKQSKKPERVQEKDAEVSYVNYTKNSKITSLDVSGAEMSDNIHMSEKEYISTAESIVKGEIKKIQYCEYSGTPWRRLSVQVLESISGSIKKGDEIAVYIIGGYLSSQEYYSYFLDKKVPKGKEDTLYKLEMRPEESIMETGDTEIFLLKRTSQESPFESTAYESVGGYDVEYLYDEKSKNYIQYQEDGKEKSWNENKLLMKLKNRG